MIPEPPSLPCSFYANQKHRPKMRGFDSPWIYHSPITRNSPGRRARWLILGDVRLGGWPMLATKWHPQAPPALAGRKRCWHFGAILQNLKGEANSSARFKPRRGWGAFIHLRQGGCAPQPDCPTTLPLALFWFLRTVKNHF